MALKYFNNHLKNMAKSPNNEWRELHQETISSLFDNTTLLDKSVLQETEERNFKFEPIEKCWIGTVGDSLTNAIKDFDDFRELYFEDCNHKVLRGTYFDHDNNYWLCYESPTELESYSHCKVRRCNNWLKWVDYDTGIFYEYPCVIDYTVSSANAQTSKTINQANSHIDVIIQGNKITTSLKKNRRFIINGCAYRYYAINNYMQNDYVTKDTPMLFMDFFLDMIDGADNLEDNIAEDYRNKFSVKCDIDRLICQSGYSGKIDAQAVRDNDTKINTVFEYISSDSNVVTVDNDGNFKIVGRVGDTAKITIRIKNNVFSEYTIPVTVTSENIHNYTVAIEPMFNDIKQGRSKIFNVNLYDNGEFVTNDFSFSADWEDLKYYKLSKNENNSFTIYNYHMNKTPINIIFENEEYNISTELTINLKASF